MSNNLTEKYIYGYKNMTLQEKKDFLKIVESDPSNEFYNDRKTRLERCIKRAENRIKRKKEKEEKMAEYAKEYNGIMELWLSEGAEKEVGLSKETWKYNGITFYEWDIIRKKPVWELIPLMHKATEKLKELKGEWKCQQ